MIKHLSRAVILFLLLYILACNNSDRAILSKKSCKKVLIYNNEGALLASRINTIEDLNRIVSIKFSKTRFRSKNRIDLSYKKKKIRIKSTLIDGISQAEISEAKNGTISDKLNLLLKSPESIRNRKRLECIYLLARWRNDLFEHKDVAFYDLAKKSTENILSTPIAYQQIEDSSDLGYINTFNHVTAQALITSIFNEETADLIADKHELHNMKDLTKPSTNNNTDQKERIDNYVDMINNEWGQEIGKYLKCKYEINAKTYWTVPLLTNYLNEIQLFYCKSFGIQMLPILKEDLVIIKFSNKLNKVLSQLN